MSFLIHNFGFFLVDVANETNTSLENNLSLQVWVCAGGLSYLLFRHFRIIQSKLNTIDFFLKELRRCLHTGQITFFFFFLNYRHRERE